jgi:hypothetical protein
VKTSGQAFGFISPLHFEDTAFIPYANPVVNDELNLQKLSPIAAKKLLLHKQQLKNLK